MLDPCGTGLAGLASRARGHKARVRNDLGRSRTHGGRYVSFFPRDRQTPARKRQHFSGFKSVSYSPSLIGNDRENEAFHLQSPSSGTTRERTRGVLYRVFVVVLFLGWGNLPKDCTVRLTLVDEANHRHFHAASFNNDVIDAFGGIVSACGDVAWPVVIHHTCFRNGGVHRHAHGHPSAAWGGWCSYLQHCAQPTGRRRDNRLRRRVWWAA